MLSVTKAACDRLLSKLTDREAADELALRFTRKTDGWLLTLDHQRPADKTFTCEGRNVLLLDANVSQAMSGMTLDVRDTEAGPRLKLHKPKTPSES